MDQKQEEEAAAHTEQFESIPWSSLVPDADPRTRRILIIVATVVAGVVIGLIGGRLIRSTTQSGVVVLPSVGAAESVAVPAPAAVPPPTSPIAAQPATPTTVVLAESIQTPLPPRLFSEADLMAVLPEEEMRAAVMRAEWFVTDFFTIDGGSSSAGDITDALPDGHAAVPLPHQSTEAGISYVEWARAYRLEPLGPARYRVFVAFRTLGGPAVGNLTRAPVRAVTVDVEVGPDGATAVSDFPSPTPPPATLALTPVEVTEMDAPPEVLADALQAATTVGSDAAPFLAGLDATGWRVVVLVGDASGLRWPLVVRP